MLTPKVHDETERKLESEKDEIIFFAERDEAWR